MCNNETLVALRQRCSVVCFCQQEDDCSAHDICPGQPTQSTVDKYLFPTKADEVASDKSWRNV